MEEIQERAFKGVWIPREIWLNNELTVVEKIIYTEIDNFTTHCQSCYAGDEHFARLIGVSKRRIQQIMKSLEEKGFIFRKIVYKQGTKEIERRYITPVYRYTATKGMEGNYPTPTAETFLPPREENYRENNTVNNNTYKDILSDKSDRVSSKIIAYLNEKAGTNYRPSTSKTQRLIHARQGEGFTLEDFKQVIDTKCSEWKGTNMAKYLRPETLFGTKFEGYLNEKAQTKAPADSWEEALRELDK